MWGESGPWDFSTLCFLCDRLSNFLDFIDIHRPWTNSASFKRWNQTLSFSFLLHQLVELGLWWYKGWIIMFDYKRKTLLRRVLICLRWLLLLPCLSVAVPARPQRVMWLWGEKRKGCGVVFLCRQVDTDLLRHRWEADSADVFCWPPRMHHSRGGTR